MKNLCILIGVPGAGKSTYCNEASKMKDIGVISTDEIREELFGNKFDDHIKRSVFIELIFRVRNHLNFGDNLLVDTTYLNSIDDRTHFINEIRSQIKNIKITAMIFDTEINICLLRNRNRDDDRRLEESVISKLYQSLDFPTESEKIDEIEYRTTSGISDKEFRELNIICENDLKVYSRGIIIGNDKYKPDLSIINTRKKVVCCIESSSSGDRKATLAEMLQAEKFSYDQKHNIDLIISLSGKSETSPTPQTQARYLQPYLKFLKEMRGNKKYGINKLLLIDQSKFIESLVNMNPILSEKFSKNCLLVE